MDVREEYIRRSLRIALTATQGSRERWAGRRATGLDNLALLDAIRQECRWVVGGSSPGGWEGYSYMVSGAGTVFDIRGPGPDYELLATLKGARLLALVREVMGVGQPAPAGQLLLL
jgi:hypothetical protein